MARKSAIAKNDKRAHLIKVSLDKRKEWKKKLLSLSAQMVSGSADAEEITKELITIMTLLDDTRRASYIRYRNRCGMTGRPRGVLRRFGLCRYAVREHASFGAIMGVSRMS